MEQFKVGFSNGKDYVEAIFKTEKEGADWAQVNHTKWLAAMKTFAMATPIKTSIRFENHLGEEIAVNGKIQEGAVEIVAAPEPPPPAHKALVDICTVCGRPNYVRVSKSAANPGRWYETCSTGFGDNTCTTRLSWRDDIPRVAQ